MIPTPQRARVSGLGKLPSVSLRQSVASGSRKAASWRSRACGYFTENHFFIRDFIRLFLESSNK